MKTALLLILITLNALAVPYPEEWWKPVPRNGTPEWEVLPQDAGPGEVILSKRNELGILSNFAPTPFTYRGKTYASVEGFWQMMKFSEGPGDPRVGKLPYSRDEVAKMVAFEAKDAGNVGSKVMKELNIDWVTFEGEKMTYCSVTPGPHYRFIKEAMLAKLNQNPEVKRILKATGDLILRPDHQPSGCGAPEWKYHEVWMELRHLL